jgi:hypothetical protein
VKGAALQVLLVAVAFAQRAESPVRLLHSLCFRDFLHARSHTNDISHMNAALAKQTERIRGMTADEKFRVAQALWTQARDTLASGVRARNPEYSTAQVAERVRELMSDAGT